jgi:hypothetical protein
MWDDVVSVSRSELVRVFVLNELADDYEEFDHISENVIKLGVDCGLTIHSSEILDALMYLIESGLAKAYRLGGPTAEEIQGVPPRDEIEHWWDGARHIGC